MTDTPKVIEVDCSTGIETIRDMTAEEISSMEASVAAYAAVQSEQEAEAAAKAVAKSSAESKLAALGLTPEEIAALR
jgi:hypothetical protein